MRTPLSMIKFLLKRLYFIVAYVVFRCFYALIKNKSLNFYKKNITRIYVLHKSPLGLGDLIMLSPLIVHLVQKLPSNVKVIMVAGYPQFFLHKQMEWQLIKKMKFIKKNSLLLMPSLTTRNIFFVPKTQYFFGYVFSDKLVSNLKAKELLYIKKSYHVKEDHYFGRTEGIVKVFELLYQKKFTLKYPKLFATKIATSVFNCTQKPYCVVAPYANWREKQYPFQSYGVIIKRLLALNVRVVVIGGRQKKELQANAALTKNFKDNKNYFDFTGAFSLSDVVYLLEKALFFIGNDSGPAHLAFLSCQKSFTIFGSVAAGNILPLTAEHRRNITAYAQTGSCSYLPCYNGFEKPICKLHGKKKVICLTSLSPDAVIKDSISYLKKMNIKY